jgi:antitoxin component of MazEF toxin-antitoxin module
MVKTISKIGNSQGLIFDSALRELTGLKAGDLVNVTVHSGGAMTILPMQTDVGATEAAAAARDLIKRNTKLFKRLS